MVYDGNGRLILPAKVHSGLDIDVYQSPSSQGFGNGSDTKSCEGETWIVGGLKFDELYQTRNRTQRRECTSLTPVQGRCERKVLG